MLLRSIIRAIEAFPVPNCPGIAGCAKCLYRAAFRRSPRLETYPLTCQKARVQRTTFCLTIFLLAGCSAPSPSTVKSHSSHPEYPAHWWAPVSKAGAPSWDILPQEAGPGEVILSNRHELGLLSNFAATPFVFHGHRYA